MNFDTVNYMWKRLKKQVLKLKLKSHLQTHLYNFQIVDSVNWYSFILVASGPGPSVRAGPMGLGRSDFLKAI